MGVDEDGIVHICPREDEVFQCGDVRRGVVEDALVRERDDFDRPLVGGDLGQMLEDPMARLEDTFPVNNRARIEKRGTRILGTTCENGADCG